MRLSLQKIFLCIALISFFQFSSSSAIAQSDDGQVKFDPGSISLNAGETVSVSIMVEDISDAFGCDFIVTYNPGIVQVSQVSSGGFLEDGFTLINSIDSSKGQFEFALTQVSPSPAKTGSGALIVFKLKGIASGNSSLKFTRSQISREDGSLVELEGSQATIQVTGTASSSSPTQTNTVYYAPAQKSATPSAVHFTTQTLSPPVKPTREQPSHTPTVRKITPRETTPGLHSPHTTPGGKEAIVTPTPQIGLKEFGNFMLDVLWWMVLLFFIFVILILTGRLLYLAIKKRKTK